VERLLRTNILRTGLLTLFLGVCANTSAAAPNANAQAGQDFGKSIMPTTSSTPSNGAAGNINIPGAPGKPGSTIRPQDLLPSNGKSSTLGGLAGSNAGVTNAANSAITNASTDTSQFGQAYKTLKGSIQRNPHTDIYSDPIWQKTDSVLAKTFAQTFAGCQQTLGPATVIIPPTTDTYSCLQITNPNITCHVTHTLGTNIIPATQRCDPATFTTKTLSVYTTPTQTITDNVSCNANSMLQHNLHSAITTVQDQICTVTPAKNPTCSISHNYTSTYTAPQPSAKVSKLAGTSGWHPGGHYWGSLEARIIGVTASNALRIGWRMSGGAPITTIGERTIDVPINDQATDTQPTNTGYYTTPSAIVTIKATCSAQTCSADIQVSGSYLVYRQRKFGAGAHPAGYVAVNFNDITMSITYDRMPKTVVTDLGWKDTFAGSGCKAKADANPTGQPPLRFVCASDPSGGAAAFVDPASGGTIRKTDMVAPYTGISSLCKQMQVTQSIASINRCNALKNNRSCVVKSTKILSNGDTQFTYACTSVSNASTVLSNCGAGTCTANL